MKNIPEPGISKLALIRRVASIVLLPVLLLVVVTAAFAVAVASAATAPAIPDSTQAPAQAPDLKLPETTAGRIASEFLKAFNSGTEQDFLEFFARNAGAAALKRHTDEERLQMNRQMKDRMGRITVRSIQASGDVGIILIAETEKAGWVRLEFNLEPEPPHKLDVIRIEDTEPPTGLAAAAPPSHLQPPPPGAPQPPPPPPPAAPLPDDKLHVLLNEFVSRAEAFGFAGGVLFARNDKVVLERGCGFADRSQGIPVTAATAFDIGSNTKDFTKMAILQLADAGKLRLDDPITKYLPGVPPDKAAITIAQLMSHTSGMPLYSGPDDEVLTRDDFLKRILAVKLISEPGREENYSNPGYSLLAAIIEKITGRSYEQYISEHILKPAGMTETGYVLPIWKPGQVAHAYADGQDTGSTHDYPHASDGPYWNLRGNGGTLATLDDMYKFHLALAGDKLLGTESKARLFLQTAPIVLAGGNGVHFFVYHRDPPAGLAIIVASTEASMRAMDMDRALVAIAMGRPVELPPAVVKLAPGAADLLAGSYALPSGAKFVVTPRNDRLAVVADGQEATNLLAALGAESVAAAELLNARALILAEASARGDYGPLAEAFGGRVPPDELKAMNEKSRQEMEARFGAFKGVRVLGTVPGQSPRGLRRTMEPAESVTVVALEFERGSAYSRFLWGGEGLVGARHFDAPPATDFVPISAAKFASYNLAAGTGTQISFELNSARRATSLSFGIGAMRTTAKRVG